MCYEYVFCGECKICKLVFVVYNLVFVYVICSEVDEMKFIVGVFFFICYIMDCEIC